MTHLRQSFGRVLRDITRKHRLRAARVAALLNVTRGTVYAMFSIRHKPSEGLVERLCEALNLTPEERGLLHTVAEASPRPKRIRRAPVMKTRPVGPNAKTAAASLMRYYRGKHRTSVDVVANAMGLDAVGYERVEKGQRTPTQTELSAFVTALNLPSVDDYALRLLVLGMGAAPPAPPVDASPIYIGGGDQWTCCMRSVRVCLPVLELPMPPLPPALLPAPPPEPKTPPVKEPNPARVPVPKTPPLGKRKRKDARPKVVRLEVVHNCADHDGQMGRGEGDRQSECVNYVRCFDVVARKPGAWHCSKACSAFAKVGREQRLTEALAKGTDESRFGPTRRAHI